MIFGYARVSTADQNLDAQIDALKNAGAEKIFTEEMTGKCRQRPGLEKLLEGIVRVKSNSLPARRLRISPPLIPLDFWDRSNRRGVHIKYSEFSSDNAPTDHLGFFAHGGLRISSTRSNIFRASQSATTSSQETFSP